MTKVEKPPYAKNKDEYFYRINELSQVVKQLETVKLSDSAHIAQQRSIATLKDVLSSIVILLEVNNPSFSPTNSNILSLSEANRLNKLVLRGHALMVYCYMLSDKAYKTLNTNEAFAEAQGYLKKVENAFYIIYGASTNLSVDIKLMESVERKLLETHMRLLSAQISAGKDPRGLSFESRKYLLETRNLLDIVQNEALELEVALARNTLIKSHENAFSELQIWLEWARGSLYIGEDQLISNLRKLPSNEEQTSTAMPIDEKGVTQEHIVNAINSLVQTQEVLIKALDMIPQTHADKTQGYALQMQSQQLLLQSMETDEELETSVKNTQEMLDQTQEYISSTRKVAEKYPDSVITFRQYLKYFEFMLEETEKALDATQVLMKQSTKSVHTKVYFNDKNEISNTVELDALIEKMLTDLSLSYSAKCYPSLKKAPGKTEKKRFKKLSEYIVQRGISSNRIELITTENDLDSLLNLYDCIELKLVK